MLKKMIEQGIIDNVPLSLFDDEENKCLKVFSSLSKFYSHLRIHTKEKPYVCSYPGCRKSFNQRGNLNQHVSLVHQDKPLMPVNGSEAPSTDMAWSSKNENTQKSASQCWKWNLLKISNFDDTLNIIIDHVYENYYMLAFFNLFR